MEGKSKERMDKKKRDKFVRYSEGAEMYLMSQSKFMQFAKDYNGSVVKTKKLSFYDELTSILGGRENPPSSYLNYATYGRSIAG